MKPESSPNIMVTAIALTIALSLLAAAQQTPLASRGPRMLQVTPKVDRMPERIAHREMSTPVLNWLLVLRPDPHERSPRTL